jgi:hypothetical protein
VLGTVTPLGERARGNNYRVTAVSLLVGSAIGGVLTGLVTWLVGVMVPLPADLRRPVLLAAAFAAVAIDFVPGLPSRLGLRRQVDDAWVSRYVGWAYGLGFGIQLGTGWATIVSSAQIVVVLAAAFVSGSVVAAVTIWLVFALMRIVPIIAMTAGASTPEALIASGRRMEDARAVVHAIVTAGGLALAIVLLVYLADNQNGLGGPT